MQTAAVCVWEILAYSEWYCELMETEPLVYLPDPLVHATVCAGTLLHRSFFVTTGSVVGYKGARGVGK